jgi:uncharacterized protein GlcG (DUF336 family)
MSSCHSLGSERRISALPARTVLLPLLLFLCQQMRYAAYCLVLALAAVVLAFEPPPSPTVGVTLNEARGALNAALNTARNSFPNIGFSIVVLDGVGNMKAFIRMDSASPGTVDVAYLKARTVVNTLLNSTFFGVVTQATTPAGGLFKFETTAGGMSSIAGGLVLRNSAGQYIGAIAASGSPNPNDDNDVATAGLSAAQAGITATSLNVPASSGCTDGLPAALAGSRADDVVSRAASIGTQQAVCLLDANGILKAYYRMDGAMLLTVDFACRKVRRSPQPCAPPVC